MSFLSEINSLCEETNDFIANSSNFVSYLLHNIENINWVGFYFDNKKELILSIFAGKPACIKIPYHKGVCGYAFSKKTIIKVDDVNSFEGHIVCDSLSKSELVIPIFYNDRVIGVLDIDSPVYSRFDEDLVELIKNALNILISKSNLTKIIKYYD
jgi:GAF domain-containing protein